MPYATKQDMIDKFGEALLVELTDRADPPAGAIDDAILDAALIEASAQIDAYLARRYKLPLAAVPVQLKRHCAVIAWYDLHRGRHTDQDRQSFDDTMKFLSDTSNGIVVLDVGGVQPPSASAEAVEESSERIFNRETLKGL